jgi:glutamate-1-semialdehyde 2,1-aminomutase
MNVVAPEGPVYQAGTLSGNPLAVAAGVATMKKLDDAAYRTLDMMGGMLEDGLSRVIRRSGVKARIQRAGSAFTLFFTDMEVTNLASAKLADTAKFAKFFHAMLDRGFYLPPAQLEAAFISLAHTPDDIESFVVAAKEVFAGL